MEKALWTAAKNNYPATESKFYDDLKVPGIFYLATYNSKFPGKKYRLNNLDEPADNAGFYPCNVAGPSYL